MTDRLPLASRRATGYHAAMAIMKALYGIYYHSCYGIVVLSKKRKKRSNSESTMVSSMKRYPLRFGCRYSLGR